MKIKQAAIFAGGLGERFGQFTGNNPKPMAPIHNRPFLEYLIEQICKWDMEEVILLSGYLPGMAADYFGSGEKYGIGIRYVVAPAGYGTQHQLRVAADCLQDHFLMMHCDILCPVNFERLVSEYVRNHAVIQIATYANEDNYAKDSLKISENGKVVIYDKKGTASGLRGVDIGYAVASKAVLDYMSDGNESFEDAVYPKLVEKSKLYAAVTNHRYYSIGPNARIELTRRYLSGQKYIFLDRDGTINKRPPKAEYVCKPEGFVWLDGAMEAVKKLNDAGYFIIMVSNQAGIAKNVMTKGDFEEVQAKMRNDLHQIGAHIDAVYYCPHGRDDNCDCRKPKPGMLYQAQRDFCINLTDCVLIGDDERDIMAAHNADMRGILVTDEYMLLDAVNDVLNGRIKDCMGA